jgi:Zn-finger nucleic acid-binding protein
MKCPVCSVDLVISDRAGIEIDYCPKCRGVWLDRGELDKIIERSAAYEAPAAAPPPPPRDDRRDYDRKKDDYYKKDDDYRKDDRYRKDDYYYKKKKGGFLGELFDFD